jgi:hypothetical protein
LQGFLKAFRDQPFIFDNEDVAGGRVSHEDASLGQWKIHDQHEAILLKHTGRTTAQVKTDFSLN